jgi:hypothetical protein
MNKYTKVDVAGDGACYFHSVVGYLELEKNSKKMKDGKIYTYKSPSNVKADALRKKVVTWLRNNLDYQMPSGLTIRDEIEDEINNNRKLSSMNDYLRDMSRPSAYAGQIEITATSNILNRSIRVFIMKGNTLSNVGLGYEINQSKHKDISLFHNLGSGKGKGKHHFEILFPKSKGLVITKTKYNTLKSKDKKKTSNTKQRKRTRRRTRRP